MTLPIRLSTANVWTDLRFRFMIININNLIKATLLTAQFLNALEYIFVFVYFLENWSWYSMLCSNPYSLLADPFLLTHWYSL